MDSEANEDYNFLVGIKSQGQAVIENVQNIIEILGNMGSRTSDEDTLKKYFSLIIELNSTIKDQLVSNFDQEDYILDYIKFSLAFTDILNTWKNSTLVEGDESLPIEICLTSTNKSCEDLIFLKKAETKMESDTIEAISHYHTHCFKNINDFCIETASNPALEAMDGRLYAYITNSLVEVFFDFDHFQDLKSIIAIISKLYREKKSDEQFMLSFKSFELVNHIIMKIISCFDGHSQFSSKDKSLSVQETTPICHKSLNYFFTVLEKFLTFFNESEFISLPKWVLDPGNSDFILNLFTLNGLILDRQELNTSNDILSRIIRLLDSINELVFVSSNDVFAQVQLIGHIFLIEAPKVGYEEKEITLLGKLPVLNTVICSLSQFPKNFLPLFFQAPGPTSTGSICLLKTLFEILNAISPSPWVRSGLDSFSNFSDDSKELTCFTSIHDCTVQAIFSCASVLSPSRFDLWEGAIMQQLLSSNHFVFLAISEAWCKIWWFLPEAVKKEQLNAFCSLLVLLPANELLRFRVCSLVNSILALDVVDECKVELVHILRKARKDFETEPLSFFLLWESLALNFFSIPDSDITAATVSVLDNLGHLFKHPNLISHILCFFSNVFRSFPDFSYDPTGIKKLSTFCLGILKNSCSSDKKIHEDTELIVNCCRVLSVAPYSFLQHHAIEIMGTLSHHLKSTKSGFIHPLMLYVTFRYSGVPVENSVQGQLTHFVKSAIHVFFEAKDWAVHYSAIWHVSKILVSGSDTLSSILPKDVQKVIFDDFSMKKDKSTRLFFTPEFPEMQVALLSFFYEWLALHPPNSFSLPEKLDEGGSAESPGLEVAISIIQKAIQQPYFMDTLDRKSLRDLGSRLLELE